MTYDSRPSGQLRPEVSVFLFALLREVYMKELALKYGCNPNQAAARIYMRDGGELPLEVMNGRPGYINLLDAFIKQHQEETRPDDRLP